MTDSTPKIAPLPSRDAIRKLKRERIENGMLFPLTATSIGLEEPIQARIRRVTTVDRAVLEQLPQDLQDTLYAGMTEFQREMKNAGDAPDPQSLIEMMTNNDKIVRAANAWCKAAFIHPRLVDAEHEITDEHTWLVTDIEPEDRVAVLMLSLDADSPQIKKLKLFRPQGGPALPNGENLSVAKNPVRVLEPAGAGVHGDGV